MVQLFSTAQLYHENQIQYNFHVPAISINTNPYQGLKRDTSIRKRAAKFEVSKAFVQRWLKPKQWTGHVQPQKPGGSIKSELQKYSTQLIQIVEQHPDFTTVEYWGETYKQRVSTSTMCRALKKPQ